MTEVPLFPLNTVVFPGVVTPLHIFEERYRALVRELVGIEKVFDRVFGVIAIREGYEVGDHGAQSVHRVGTLVQLSEAEAYDDGRFDIEVIGRQRLRVLEHDSSGPFLRGEVELLGDVEEPEAEVEAARTLAVFESYREQLSELRGARGRDFDRAFRPTSGRSRARWERIASAYRTGQELPPIRVRRVGDMHFVVDGHHRVSAARALGLKTLDARVTEVRTQVEPATSEFDLRTHVRLFAERVSPDSRISV